MKQVLVISEAGTHPGVLDDDTVTVFDNRDDPVTIKLYMSMEVDVMQREVDLAFADLHTAFEIPTTIIIDEAAVVAVEEAGK